MAGGLYAWRTKQDIIRAVRHFTHDEAIRARLYTVMGRCEWERGKIHAFVKFLHDRGEGEFAKFIREIE
jgi:hypothetical protein